MSFLGDIAKVAGGVIGGPVGGILGDVAGKLGDVAGGAAGNILGEVANGPLSLLANSPDKQVANLWKDVAGVLRGGNNNRCGDDMTYTGSDGCHSNGGSTGTTDTSSGGGIFDKIFAILQKLQDQLNTKVKDLDGLDPNQDKAALDKGLFEVQQLQQQMTQLTSMATNLSSADHNSKKGIVDNFNIR
jgi:hypothetical protein